MNAHFPGVLRRISLWAQWPILGRWEAPGYAVTRNTPLEFIVPGRFSSAIWAFLSRKSSAPFSLTFSDIQSLAIIAAKVAAKNGIALVID